jgi:hypothetical protein
MLRNMITFFLHQESNVAIPASSEVGDKSEPRVAGDVLDTARQALLANPIAIPWGADGHF